MKNVQFQVLQIINWNFSDNLKRDGFIWTAESKYQTVHFDESFTLEYLTKGLIKKSIQ